MSKIEGPLLEEGRGLDDHRPGHPGRSCDHPQLHRGLVPALELANNAAEFRA
jgi:hypothetical protein